MHTHDRGVLAGWHNAKLFAIPPTVRGGLYARRPEWSERVECCRVSLVPMLPIFVYYTNLVISDHLGATAGWYMAALELVAMALIWFLVVVERVL